MNIYDAERGLAIVSKQGFLDSLFSPMETLPVQDLFGMKAANVCIICNSIPFKNLDQCFPILSRRVGRNGAS